MVHRDKVDLLIEWLSSRRERKDNLIWPANQKQAQIYQYYIN